MVSLLSLQGLMHGITYNRSIDSHMYRGLFQFSFTKEVGVVNVQMHFVSDVKKIGQKCA